MDDIEKLKEKRGMKTKHHVLELNRLMVRVESMELRSSLLTVLEVSYSYYIVLFHIYFNIAHMSLVITYTVCDVG